MLPNLHDDPNLWFQCATEMRGLAETMESDGKAIALKVANDLEWLADWLTLRNERLKSAVDRLGVRTSGIA